MYSLNKMSNTTKKAPTFADRYAKDKKRVHATTAGALASSQNGDDFLLPKDDVARVPGQNYLVFSYAAPENSRLRCNKVAVKFSGAFDTLENAQAHAKKINAEDTRLDVHICKMYTWGTIPMPEDVKPFVEKEYTDKFLTRVMKGQQETLLQSKKEMEERMAKDRAKAEEEVRKKYGPDYVMAKKNDTVMEYERETMEREEKADKMKFTQRELVDSFSKYIQSNGKIDPEIAGDFMRFLEAKKAAELGFKEQDAAAAASSSSSSAPAQ